MKVKAVLNLEVGGRLVVDDLDIGEPGPTHVVVKQFATGVCHSQLHQIHNPALPRPLVLGHESTGVVVTTGREVTHVRAGDRVMLTWVQRQRLENTPDPTPWRATYKGQQVRHGDREGRLPLDKLVTRRYTLEQINDACEALAHGEISGRAIVEF